MVRKFKNPVKLEQSCKVCGVKFNATVEKEDLDNRKNGLHVQNAFPYLTPGERELFFMTHICDACWEDMFKEED